MVPKQNNFFFHFFKRVIDIFAAVIGLILFSPVYLIIVLFYLFGENKGAPIFKQQRIGKNGKIFNIYKFRSMVVGAEEKLKKNEVLYQKYIKNSYKLEPHEDPRMTKFGNFIRKTSLDELPQFINVLKGEMSLVGPRPVVKEELNEYGYQVNAFTSVKPGITGYWQVSGRSDVGYPERVDIELYYIEHASLYLDLKIICLTFVCVLTKKGTY
nr:sugar transferase [Isobaculum melis]